MSPILLYHWLGRSLLMGRYERRRPVPSSLHLLAHPRTVAIKQSIRKTGVTQGIKWPLRPGQGLRIIAGLLSSAKGGQELPEDRRRNGAGSPRCERSRGGGSG